MKENDIALQKSLDLHLKKSVANHTTCYNELLKSLIYSKAIEKYQTQSSTQQIFAFYGSTDPLCQSCSDLCVNKNMFIVKSMDVEINKSSDKAEDSYPTELSARMKKLSDMMPPGTCSY